MENTQHWVCNECGFPNYTTAVSEQDIEKSLACSNCGCDEFHLEPKEATRKQRNTMEMGNTQPLMHRIREIIRNNYERGVTETSKQIELLFESELQSLRKENKRLLSRNAVLEQLAALNDPGRNKGSAFGGFLDAMKAADLRKELSKLDNNE